MYTHMMYAFLMDISPGILCKVVIKFTLANNQIKRDKQLLGTHLGLGVG